MPLLLRTSTPHETMFAVWETTERLDELLRVINADWAKEETESFHSEKRKAEYLAVRALLRTAFPQHFGRIAHDADGKPHLPSPMRISISHTAGFAAISLAERETGIDIERMSDKPLKVRERILTPQELVENKRSPHPAADALLRWSGKEAVFKIVGKEAVDFRNSILTSGLEMSSQGRFQATVGNGQKTRTLEVNFLLHEQFALTIAEEL